jgi:PAB1-binding protein PBP1
MATREANIKAAGASIAESAKSKEDGFLATVTLTDPVATLDEQALILSIASYKLLSFIKTNPANATAKKNLQIILVELTKSLFDANSAYLSGGGKQAKPKSKKASVRSAKKVSRKKATKRGGGGVAANAADIMNSTGLLRTSNDPLTQANSPAIIALTRQDPAVTAGMTGLSAIDATSDFPSSVTGEIVHNLGGLYLS